MHPVVELRRYALHPGADVVVWLTALKGDEAERWPAAQILRLEPTAGSRLR